MTLVVVGRVCDREGMAISRGPLYGSVVECRAIGAGAYLAEQPADIAVDVDHDGTEVGRVEYLERDNSGLWAVAECTVDEVADLSGPMFYSGSVEARSGDPGAVWEASSAVLHALSLTFDPAQVGAIPVAVVRGRLEDGPGCISPRLTTRERELVERAIAYKRRRYGRGHEAHRIAEPVDPSTATRIGRGWLVDGELQVEQRARATGPREDRPRNLAADIEGGVFAVNVGRVQVAPRAKLMLGPDPVGMHYPERDHGAMTVFTVTATAKGLEALTLTAEGVYETASPLYRFDGRCTAVSIDLD